MRYALPLLFVVFSSGTYAAEKQTTYRTTPGKILLEQQFDQPALPSDWKVAKGNWTIVDGAINGDEKPEDMHGGVLSAKLELPATLVVTASLRFEGSPATSMVFNGAGHICRISVNPKGFSVTGDADKNDANDKSVSIGKVEQAFTAGQWYQFTIEITGEEILVYTDDKHVVYGKHAKIARKKTAFALTVAKTSIRFGHIVIRAAEPNSDWEKNKTTLGIK